MQNSLFSLSDIIKGLRRVYSIGGGNARRCHMLTLCKSTILGAAFLAGVAIAASADPASTSAAAGTVANGVSGSQSQGRGLAALPPSTAAPPPHYTTFATGKNQIEEYSNEVEDTRHHRDRSGAGDQRVCLR